MKLSEIEEVARVVKDGPDYGLIESKVIQGISMLPVGTRFYTAEQMQEYAKAKVFEALGKYGVRDDEWSDHEVDLAHKQMTKFIFRGGQEK